MDREVAMPLVFFNLLVQLFDRVPRAFQQLFNLPNPLDKSSTAGGGKRCNKKGRKITGYLDALRADGQLTPDTLNIVSKTSQIDNLFDCFKVAVRWRHCGAIHKPHKVLVPFRWKWVAVDGIKKKISLSFHRIRVLDL